MKDSHNGNGSKKVWIDLDNSPHVPFFYPIIRELEGKGHRILATCRNCFQVCGLAQYYGMEYRRIGRHYGANKLMKVIGTFWRSMLLAVCVMKERPDLAVSHGSRPMILVSWLLGIPSLLLFDYEYAKPLPVAKVDIGMVPEVIHYNDNASHFRKGMRTYCGLKEDVYVASYKPHAEVLNELGLDADDLIVTIRPPANEAHYHNAESERLFSAVVEFIGSIPEAKMVILPRNEKKEKDAIQNAWPGWCREGKIIIPPRVVNGLDLIWYSDIVISGGGTMNREAAALGVPVYSIFRGKIGAVDQFLASSGRLILIERAEEVESKIKLQKRVKDNRGDFTQLKALGQIVATIEELMGADAVHAAN